MKSTKTQNTKKQKKMSNPKPEHTTGESGRRGARQRGGVERGRVRGDADGLVRRKTTVPFPREGIVYNCPERLLRGNEQTNLSNPKPGHTTGGSKRGGARCGGGAGQDRMSTARFAQETTAPRAPQTSKTTVLNDFSEARTNEFQYKPMGEQNVRLTTGLSTKQRPLFVPCC